MHCDQFVEKIDAYLAEELGENDRRTFRDHLAACPECRAQAIAADPTLLFALGGRPEPDPARVDACAAAVTALIHQDRLQQRMRPRVPRWMMAAAAVLFMVLGGAALWQRAPAGPVSNPEIAVAEDVTAPEAAPPRVEVDMVGEGVRVYQFAQDEDDNTAVCFIVNAAMEL